jgi:CRP/FNR family transcriptional regulator, cyclic AMP receptor protein
VQTSLFRKFALFAELDERELQSIAAVAKTRRYAKDDVVFHADESGDVFCLIREGQVKVTMISPEGKEIILSMMGPGDFFGEMALLGDTTRNADVVASSPMTAMVMTDTAFRSLARKMPDVAQEIREQCRRRTEELHQAQ